MLMVLTKGALNIFLHEAGDFFFNLGASIRPGLDTYSVMTPKLIYSFSATAISQSADIP